MRIFKITISILVALVIGLIFLQLHLTRVKRAGIEDPPGVSPVQAPRAPSNAVPSANVLDAPVGNLLPDSEKTTAKALISRSEETDVVWTSQTPAAKRVRRIFPDTGWMTPDPVLKAGDVITLELFDDAVFEAEIRNVTVYPNGAVGMTAHLTGDKHGTVYISYSGQQMRASVEVPGGADYYSRYDVGTDSHYAIEIDPEKTITRDCGGDHLISPDDYEQHDSISEPTVAAGPLVLGDVPAGSTVVDVMIVYTPAALAMEGNVANMNNNIAQAMERANEAHTNSNTQITLRLVHSDEVTYTESGSDNTDLNRLTNVGDNQMDEVHDWRDEYGVDLICLFADTASVGGLGWLLTNPYGDDTDAFCLAFVGQTDWTYTLVHEWGHNMGCSHSKTQSVQPWEPNSHFRAYSAGWQWNDTASSRGGYCTVMTYEDANDDDVYEYKRVAHFSNPDINYVGNSTNATGDAEDGDNARTMREMKLVYEAYRESTFIPDPDIDDDGIPNEWEQFYFGGQTNANPVALASNGVNTVMEAYIADISPINPNEFFNVSSTGGNGFVVRWNATSGRVYSVHGATNLQDSFQPLETNILWPQNSWTDTVPRVENYYRIDVELQK